jgi:hypothetical protein
LEVFDQLDQRNEEVEDLIGGSGFVSYTASRSGEAGLTVTVCQDKTGTEESSRRAADWVKENIGATANPPVIAEGGTVATSAPRGSPLGNALDRAGVREYTRARVPFAIPLK